MTGKRPRKAVTRGNVAAVPTPAAIKVVLIDDNRLLREGLVALIRSQPGFMVLAALADVDEALAKVREAAPDVVLLDFGLADHDSLGLTARVHREIPATRVIVMGLLAAHEDVAAYIHAGASGFIMKDASFEEFFATIRAVAAGGEVLPTALTNSLFTQILRHAVNGHRARALQAVRLTARERQVIDLLSAGRSNKEIAAKLNIALHTVKSHVHNVLEKLALRSRLEVAAFVHGGEASTVDER